MKSFKRWKSTNKEMLTDIKKLAIAVYIDGILANIVASALFGQPFNPLTITGWGVLLYFVKTELVAVIRKCRS
jgi:hypothetical protein